MSFKEFLQEDNSTEFVDGATLANSLTKTLGRKLVQNGWHLGSRGSGIVAMIDDKGAASEQQVKDIITKFLKNIGSKEKLAPGKLTGSMSVKYRGGLISVVDTGKGMKITVS